MKRNRLAWGLLDRKLHHGKRAVTGFLEHPLDEFPRACWNNPKEWDRIPTAAELPDPPDYGRHRVFHYSTTFRLAQILRQGIIDVWWEEGMPRIAHVVWLSTNPIFEMSCVAAVELGVANCGGLTTFQTPGEPPSDAIRIEVRASAAPYLWRTYWAWCGVSGPYIGHYGALDQEEHGGNPEEWYVTPIPIPASEWLAVEIFDPETLQWNPITLSLDRMVGELITLLPAHLRPPVVDTPDETQRRLSPTLRDSQWCLQNIGLQYRTNANGQPFKTDTPCLVDEGVMEKYRNVCHMWRMADGFARAGVPVFPLDEDGRPLSPWERHNAVTSLEPVDCIWLQEHPSVRIGVVLGTPSPGIVGLRLSGWHRRYAPWQGGRLPATWRFHEEDGENRHVFLLFRTPPGLTLPSGVLARSARGCIELIGHETWIRGPGRYGKYGIYRIAGPKEIAPLPDWVIKLALRISPSNTKEK